MENNIDSISKSSISRRDFLKLKSFLMLWYYFFQSLGVNLLQVKLSKKSIIIY